MKTTGIKLAILFSLIGSCTREEGNKRLVAIPQVESVTIPESRVRVTQPSCEIDDETFVDLQSGGLLQGDSKDHPNSSIRQAVVVIPSFKIDRRTVGCAQWRACVAAGACTEEKQTDCLDDLVLKRHSQAAELCRWRGGRLPTYVEWQRAVRGKSGKVSAFGPGHDLDRSCEPGRPVRRFYNTCELTSEDNVITYTADGEEWTLDIPCTDKKRGRQYALRVTPITRTGRLDRYGVYLVNQAAADAETPGYQFRCVVP